MLNKITLALSAALVLGAVSTASAAFDPWLVTTDHYVNMPSGGHNAFASVDRQLDVGRVNDARYDASAW